MTPSTPSTDLGIATAVAGSAWWGISMADAHAFFSLIAVATAAILGVIGVIRSVKGMFSERRRRDAAAALDEDAA